MEKSLKREALLKILSILILTLSTGLYFSFEKIKVEVDIEERLREVVDSNYLEKKIVSALKCNNLDDALIYIDLANFLDIEVDKRVLKMVEEKRGGFYDELMRNVKDFTDGLFGKNINNMPSLCGSIVSDMTFIGDVRDLYIEGNRMINGQDYDKSILGLSSLGIVLTTTTYFSAGVSSPIKIGESIVKVAKKSGTLTNGFEKILLKRVFQSINFKLLERVDFSSFKNIESTFSKIVKSVNLKPLKKLLMDVEKVSKNTSQVDTIKLMRYVDKPEDLEKIVKVSEKFGKHTLAVFKILGKGALRSFKTVIRYTVPFLLQLIALIVSVIIFTSLLIFKISRIFRQS
jgi:uncharacterized protein YkvS